MAKIAFKNLKQIHGAQIVEKGVLEKMEKKEKKSLASIPPDLESLTLAQLKEIAHDLGIFEIDNKNLLIKAISKEIRNT